MRRNLILFRGNNIASLHPNKQLIGSGFRRKHSRHYNHGGAIALPSFFNKLNLDPVPLAHNNLVSVPIPRGFDEGLRVPQSMINDFITHKGGAILKTRPKGKKPIKFLL
jgi:hypothetical protein